MSFELPFIVLRRTEYSLFGYSSLQSPWGTSRSNPVSLLPVYTCYQSSSYQAASQYHWSSTARSQGGYRRGLKKKYCSKVQIQPRILNNMWKPDLALCRHSGDIARAEHRTPDSANRISEIDRTCSGYELTPTVESKHVSPAGRLLPMQTEVLLVTEVQE